MRIWSIHYIYLPYLIKQSVVDLFGHIQPPKECCPCRQLDQYDEPADLTYCGQYDDEEASDHDGECHVEEFDDLGFVHKKRYIKGFKKVDQTVTQIVAPLTLFHVAPS